MPFLTEEIWHALYAGIPPAKSIALTRFPQAHDYACDTAALAEMATLQELITTIRGLRKELGIPEKESAPIHIHAADAVLSPLQFSQDILARLARVSGIEISAAPLTGNNARSTSSFDVAITYERQIDIPAERERLTRTSPNTRRACSPPTASSPTTPSWPKPPPTSSKASANKPPKPAPSTTKPAPPSTP